MTPGELAAAAMIAGAGMTITKVETNEFEVDKPPTPTEPPPEVAQHFSGQELNRARKQRWLEGHDIPEADRVALEAAAARRARRAAKRQR